MLVVGVGMELLLGTRVAVTVNVLSLVGYTELSSDDGPVTASALPVEKTALEEDSTTVRVSTLVLTG